MTRVCPLHQSPCPGWRWARAGCRIHRQGVLLSGEGQWGGGLWLVPQPLWQKPVNSLPPGGSPRLGIAGAPSHPPSTCSKIPKHRGKEAPCVRVSRTTNTRIGLLRVSGKGIRMFSNRDVFCLEYTFISKVAEFHQPLPSVHGSLGQGSSAVCPHYDLQPPGVWRTLWWVRGQKNRLSCHVPGWPDITETEP